MFVCFMLFCGTVSAPRGPRAGCFPRFSSAHWVTLRFHHGLFDPHHFSTWPPSRVCRDTPPPKALLISAGFLTHNFSVFLFCSSVLHLHPCRYCSFVPSTHPHLNAGSPAPLALIACTARCLVMANIYFLFFFN